MHVLTSPNHDKDLFHKKQNSYWLSTKRGVKRSTMLTITTNKQFDIRHQEMGNRCCVWVL